MPSPSKKIVIIAAPSGAGKTSVTRHLLKSLPDQLAFSISCATRLARNNEQDKVDYYFISVDAFKERINRKEFVEWEMVYAGKYYGTLKSELYRIWQEHKTPLLDVDVKGGLNVQQLYPEQSLSLFIEPPSIDELERRLKARGISKPGGDKIGRRRLDTHITGFEKLGAQFTYHEEDGFFHLAAPDLKGSELLLDEPSVTGTANIIMAAVMANGNTRIYNAACEPYIQQLCNMLNRMGAKISGIGSNLLSIEGVDYLSGTEHQMLPDMIEVGSFIGLAAMTQSDITIKGAGISQLGIIPDKFRQLGIEMIFSGDDIHIPAQKIYEIQTFLDGSVMTIADHPWPGLTPDLLSIILVTAIQAKGSVLIHQKMFESRLFFVDKLIDMGARIVLCDPHRAVVIGLEREQPLRGIVMSSPDIRAGVALLIAALSAEGKSIIQNIEQIDRGYQDIDGRLRKLGADITRM